jgi:hypothetical protein
MVPKEKGAKKIENKEHGKLLDQIERCQALNYVKESDDDDDDDDSEELSGKEGASDESDSNDESNEQEEVGEANA